MADLGFSLNPNDYDTTQNSYDVIPAGEYAMQVVESAVKPTKAGTGMYAELVFEMLEQHHPELKGRKVWARINYKNPNPKAQEMGLRDIARLGQHTGVGVISNTEQLHFKPLVVKLKVKNDPNYGMQNEVSGYDSLPQNGGVPAPAQQPPAHQQPVQQQPAHQGTPRKTSAATTKAPWE